jgi:hypothetical protein
MTIWYLLGAVIVLGMAIVTMLGGGGGTTFGPLVWLGRVLPVVAALIACVAFCLPLFMLSTLMLVPHLMSVRNSNFYSMLLTIYPVLMLFPAFALWHLATALKRRTR